MALKIILTGHGYNISKKGGLLVIARADGSKKEVSIGNVSMVLANLKGLSISGEALRLMLKHGVPLILLSKDKPVGKIQPMMLKTHVRLRKEQVKAQEDARRFKIASTIILNKMLNQMKVLKRISKTRPISEQEVIDEKVQQIYSVYKDVSESGIDARSWLLSKEAEASRHYWEALAKIVPKEIGFTGRKKKYENPEDPLNVSLNYLYTLLMYQVWYAVELSGLDPFIGYLHEDSNRRPSLVMDLMEEFRQPIVDYPLIRFLLKRKIVEALDDSRRLKDSFRKELLQLFFNTLEKNVTFMNRAAPIKAQIRLQPIRLARYLLNHADRYICFDVVM